MLDMLQVANHLIFVHPFHSLNNHQRSAWEAQAIGRVLRQGQTRQVTIWRFVSMGTMEQELLVQGNLREWKKHFGE